MGAYGDITCEWCGRIYHEQSDHECDTQDVKDEITRLRAENDELRNQICGFKHLDDLRICMFETADKNEALRKALDRIKVRAYELGAEEIHDMALAALRGEREK